MSRSYQAPWLLYFVKQHAPRTPRKKAQSFISSPSKRPKHMQSLPTLQPAGLRLPQAGDENVPALKAEIRALAAERNAVILAHNYEVPEIQQVADYVGDSLGLSQKAAAAGADM